MVPLYQLDKGGFRKMIKAINPRYQVHTRIVLTESLYHLCMMKYTLMWRRKWQTTHSTIQQQQIYGLPVQQNPTYATPSITLMMTGSCNVIVFRHISCMKATLVTTSRMLSSTLQEWNLDDSRQVVITTDNTSNVKLTCQLLK